MIYKYVKYLADSCSITEYYFLFVFALAGILEYIGMMIPVGGTARHKIAPEPKLRNVEFATVDFDRSEELVKSVLVAAQPGSQIVGETDGYYTVDNL